MDEKENSGLSRAFMAIYSLLSLSLSLSVCLVSESSIRGVRLWEEMGL